MPSGGNYRQRRWTDDQILRVLKAGPLEYRGVAEAMGMSVRVAAKYRGSESVIANRLRDAHPEISRPAARKKAKSETSTQRLRRIIYEAVLAD